MTMQTLSQITRSPISALVSALFARRNAKAKPAQNPADRQVERDNMAEMLWSHPEVFSNEYDVEFMMNMSRGRG